MAKRTIEGSVIHSSTLIMNASRHPRVKLKMANFGYNDLRMEEALGLLNTFQLLQAEKDNCYSRKLALKQQWDQDSKALKAMYNEHLTIARFAFRTDAYMQGQLQLKGKRRTDWAGWIIQVLAFYQSAEAEGLTALKKHGAKAEDIAQGKAMADALKTNYEDRVSIEGDAQTATQKRSEALKALKRWVADFKKVARVALQDEPQLLETLGIVVPTAA